MSSDGSGSFFGLGCHSVSSGHTLSSTTSSGDKGTVPVAAPAPQQAGTDPDFADLLMIENEGASQQGSSSRKRSSSATFRTPTVVTESARQRKISPGLAGRPPLPVPPAVDLLAEPNVPAAHDQGSSASGINGGPERVNITPAYIADGCTVSVEGSLLAHGPEAQAPVSGTSEVGGSTLPLRLPLLCLRRDKRLV